MIEFFTFEFIQRALWVGAITAVAAALLGNFIVVARQAMMSDMLAHAALAGVGVGLLIGTAPFYWAGIAAIGASVLLWFLTRDGKRPPEAIAMLLLTGGLALALLFAHIARDNPTSLESFLFGSLLTITEAEVIIFTLLCAILVAVLLYFWRRFLIVVFDAQLAHVQFRYAWMYELLLFVMTGLIVAIALKVVGGLLIGALLVIPVVAAQNISYSFKINALLSVVIGVIGVFSGIATSFFLDVPTSSGIVLSLIGLFVLTLLYKNITR